MNKIIKISTILFMFLMSMFIAGFENSEANELTIEGDTRTCYDTFKIGNVYYNVNCSGCKAQRNEVHKDVNTCTQ